MKNTHQSSLDCQKLTTQTADFTFSIIILFFGGGVVVQSLKVRNITNSSQLSITHLVAVLTFAKI